MEWRSHKNECLEKDDTIIVMYSDSVVKDVFGFFNNKEKEEKNGCQRVKYLEFLCIAKSLYELDYRTRPSAPCRIRMEVLK